jgi:hypothetical protein
LRIGRLDDKAPEVTLGDDSPVRTRFIGVGAQCLVGFEVHVALDGKLESAAHRAQFDEGDVTELGFAEAQIAKSKGEVAIGV